MPPGRYARPPIVEAIIELRFASEASVSQMERFNRAVRRHYPLTQPAYEVSIKLEVSDDTTKPNMVSEQTFSNYRLTGVDNAQIVLLGSSSLACAQLAPYSGWEKFIAIF